MFGPVPATNQPISRISREAKNWQVYFWRQWWWSSCWRGESLWCKSALSVNVGRDGGIGGGGDGGGGGGRDGGGGAGGVKVCYKSALSVKVTQKTSFFCTLHTLDQPVHVSIPDRIYDHRILGWMTMLNWNIEMWHFSNFQIIYDKCRVNLSSWNTCILWWISRRAHFGLQKKWVVSVFNQSGRSTYVWALGQSWKHALSPISNSIPQPSWIG